MIEISARVERLYDALPAIGREQLPFGLALGLAQTGKDVRDTQRRGMRQRFTLRRPSWVLGNVAIREDDWAIKTRLRQRIRVGLDEPAARARFAPLLARHERGGYDVGEHWIPAHEGGLRSSFGILVPQRMRPWALGLWRTDRQQGAGVSGAARRQGKHRTFSLVNRRGELVGIYQRYGLTIRQIVRRVKRGQAPTVAERRDAGIRMIWRYQQGVRIKPRLGFGDTSQLVVRMRLRQNIGDGLARAVRTARPR